MGYHHYDRLTALDALFLEIEDPNVHIPVRTARSPSIVSRG